MNYTVEEFIEIIRDIDGIKFIRDEVRNGYPVAILESRDRMLIIDKEFEDLDDELGKYYLRALEIDFMIGALFPTTSPEVHN